MKFTKKQKNDYLDNLALATQQGIWLTELALMKDQDKLAGKMELLRVAQSEEDRVTFKEQIANLEQEIEEEKMTIDTGKDDLKMIEQYRIQK